MIERSLSRRGLFRVAGVTAGGVGFAGLAAACGGGSNNNAVSDTTTTPARGATPSETGTPTSANAPTTGSGGASATPVTVGGVQLPTYAPFAGVTPDYPAQLGGDPGFNAYPANPPQMLSAPPLKGGSVTMLAESGTIVPASRNKLWQNVNKVLGTNLQLQYTPRNTDTYNAKFATVIAGGDIPDTASIVPPMPNIPDILKAKFQDLTPFLSGDNVKNYPSLAAIPTQYWRISLYNGGIYGVPFSRGPIARFPLYRADITQQMGLKTDLSNGQDFLDLCKALTDTKHNRWALAMVPTTDLVGFVQMMCGAPNVWKEEAGKFTSTYETDETRRALDLVTQIWKAGYVYPDSFGSINSFQLVIGGQAVIEADNMSTWVSYVGGTATTKPVAGVVLGGLTLPKWDGGGKAPQYLRTYAGGYGFSAVKKANDDRVRDVLQVLNWFAAPFGTKEYLQQFYGVEGVDYTLQGSDPVLTKTGIDDNWNNIGTNIASRPEVIYNPGHPDITKTQSEFVEAVTPTALSVPTDGLYSATDSSKGSTLRSNMQSLIGDVIQGRKSLSDWDNGVKNWQSQGGNTIRSEYERAYQQQHQ